MEYQIHSQNSCYEKSLFTLTVILITVTVLSQWQTIGNGGMGYGNFIGTIDIGPLQFRVNNYQAGFIDPTFNNLAYGPFSLYTNPKGIPCATWVINANTAIGINPDS